MIEQIKDYWLTFKGILYFHFFLRRSCYRPEEKVKKEQYRKLKKLLLVCEQKVPYYQDLFHRIGFDVVRDFKSLEDLSKIPVTPKEAVKQSPEKFLNPDYRGKSLTFKTSGSTGNPLSVSVSKNQWVTEQGVIWRHWSWAGYRLRDKMAIVRSFAPKDHILIKHDKIRNFRYYSPFHLSEGNIGNYLEDMIREKVKFLRGYPSSIKPLAEYIKKHRCEIPRLKAILTASEVLTHADREFIEEAFGCRIFNHYGLAEGIVMMGDCERHKGLHNYDEYGYVELLDTDDPHIKKIVGTNLNNYAMPLLRYQTNDLAEVAGEKCTCARSSHIVKNIIGRSNAVIRLEDREIPLTNFYTVLEYYTDIISWQIVQNDLKSIELRIEGNLRETERQTILAEFSRRLPDGVQFAIRTDIPPIKKHEGKQPTFVSLLQ